MKPIITKELIETLELHPRTDTVYFETETGKHHFNHAKTGKKGEPALSINKKEVVAVDRKEVLKSTITHITEVKEGRIVYTPVSAGGAKGGAKGSDDKE